jgi:hypothetical protein
VSDEWRSAKRKRQRCRKIAVRKEDGGWVQDVAPRHSSFLRRKVARLDIRDQAFLPRANAPSLRIVGAMAAEARADFHLGLAEQAYCGEEIATAAR